MFKVNNKNTRKTPLALEDPYFPSREKSAMQKPGQCGKSVQSIMFKVNNKGTRITSFSLFWRLYC